MKTLASALALAALLAVGSAASAATHPPAPFFAAAANSSKAPASSPAKAGFGDLDGCQGTCTVTCSDDSTHVLYDVTPQACCRLSRISGLSGRCAEHRVVAHVLDRRRVLRRDLPLTNAVETEGAARERAAPSVSALRFAGSALRKSAPAKRPYESAQRFPRPSLAKFARALPFPVSALWFFVSRNEREQPKDERERPKNEGASPSLSFSDRSQARAEPGDEGEEPKNEGEGPKNGGEASRNERGDTRNGWAETENGIAKGFLGVGIARPRRRPAMNRRARNGAP